VVLCATSGDSAEHEKSLVAIDNDSEGKTLWGGSWRHAEGRMKDEHSFLESGFWSGLHVKLVSCFRKMDFV